MLGAKLIVGNNDVMNLSDSQTFCSKEISEGSVVDEMVSSNGRNISEICLSSGHNISIILFF